ncbi:hypothetical protein HX13_15855 [Chryseobacterium sp. P1-3]|uniref:Uncharacterized protein n=2 Tax=Chryseobacterium gallinarum TaxID=1324352 RepID=A0A0G3M1P8_CHRGL|nr:MULTISPECIES: hypothetical protein [Chryseobacterium]AKK72530.1 hypothetical protein OK18_07710 [Chryseobacterium gallinarum]KFF73993.1 hypothetical protein HX13_15855 [Chryseobacterium sp. P1-3]MCL8536139.1 hypothetical protein [Chryseobacterium gallinarum]
MKTLTILEAGNLAGVVIMIIGIIILGALFISVIATFVVKLIYEWKGDRKFSKKQFIQTMLICLLVCGLISGYICGGGF